MDDQMPAGPEGTESDEERFSVLEVFGLKLEVSNPRLAELLTMDAKSALNTDLRDLASPQDVRDLREVTAQALPDVVVAPPTPRQDVEDAERQEFRDRVAAIGRTLGFETSPDGVWESPMGLEIITRSIERQISLAGAIHYVNELAERRDMSVGAEATVLFVVDGQQSVDVFRVAIRQRRVYDVMRVVSISSLEEINAMAQAGRVDHAKAVVLLTPAANIDVGELLSVIRAASHGED